MTKRRRVPVNENGYRIGEGHHNCTIPDAVVVRIRDLFEYDKLTSREIARKTGVKFCAVRKIVKYERRADIPRDYIEVDDGDNEEGR